MLISWEKLQLSAAAERRKQAKWILDLGQLIGVAAWNDKDGWRSKQQQLVAALRAGLT